MWEGNLVAGRSVRATARFANVLAPPPGELCRHGQEPAGQEPYDAYFQAASVPSPATLQGQRARRTRISSRIRVVWCSCFSAVRRRCAGSIAAVWDGLQNPGQPGERHPHDRPRQAYADALKAREALPATRWRGRYKPYPFLRAEMTDALVAQPTCLLAAPAPRRSPRPARWACRWSSSRTRTHPHTRWPTRAPLADAGAARIVADEDFNADALLSSRPPSGSRRRAAGHDAAPRQGHSAARAPRPLLPNWSSPLAERSKLPPLGSPDRSTCRKPPRDRRDGSERTAAAHRKTIPSRDGHPAAHRGQDVAPGAAGPLHHDACRWPGGPVRGGAQPFRAARSGAFRAVTRAALLHPRAWLGPGHQQTWACGAW